MIDERARAVLEELERQNALERERGVSRSERLRQITPEVGRFLHVLALATRPRSILEIGTSGGYSTVWFAAAARPLGGSITTIEIDPAKVDRATSTVRQAGVEDLVTIVLGDAFDYLRDRDRPIDFVFLYAEKEDYLRFLELIVPLLRIGGLLVADNLNSHAEELATFRRRAESDPRLHAVVVPIGRGELLAVRIG